jgi:dynein light intermediate chain, axonemal
MQPSLIKYTPPALSGISGKQEANKTAKVSTGDAQDALNAILPPREWTEGEKIWVQYVSTTPATRIDVVNLQDELDKRLKIRQSRETGICPIREELYAEAFDEIIRQVAIICTERGLLMLRARDELRMNIREYRTLYEKRSTQRQTN